MNTTTIQTNRSGHIAVLTALLLIVILGMLAWAIDIGWICMTKTQLHAAADSAALAGGTEMLPGLGFKPTRTPEESDPIIRAVAADYASRNRAGDKSSVYVEPDRDIFTGKGWFDKSLGRWEFEWGGVPINAVKVVPKRNVQGGSGDEPLNLLFAPVLGTETSDLSVYATAVILPANGFKIVPGSGESVKMVPFAFEYRLWEKYFRAQDHFENTLGCDPSLITEGILDPEDGHSLYFLADSFANPQLDRQLFTDRFSYSKAAATGGASGVIESPDQILELNIFPINQTSGNFGTIDLGSPNNSAADLVRQILTGVNEEDLSYFDNNTIVATHENPLIVEGDTGLSAGIQKALESIEGQVRTIALFTGVVEPGNNSQFTIVEFVGVRFMRAQLKGNDKRLYLQPCVVSDSTGVPNYDDEIGENTTVFTSLILAE